MTGNADEETYLSLLRTMGVYDRAISYIRETKNIHVNLDTIPITDKNIYQFIQRGFTAGVFQLESNGMTGLMGQLYQDVHKLPPTEKVGTQLFERLIAGVSLYRPGPMDEIPNYIDKMLSPERITYEIPALEPILSPTYSIIVYQEQVMGIVRELAGFTKGQADGVRKAMGKKIEELLQEYGHYFIHGDTDKNIAGVIKNGIDPQLAKELWDKMEKFGLYAFNKSHGAAYADIAYRGAWFSYYHPVEFFTAQLNSFLSSASRIRQFMMVCKDRNIKVLPPSVNYSKQDFSVDGESIRFGLGGIRNMGNYGISIIQEREKNGAFTTFYDFVERMVLAHGLTKPRLEALIYSGALDEFDGTRIEKRGRMDLLIAAMNELKELKDMGYRSLFKTAAFSSWQSFLFHFDKTTAPVVTKELMRLEREYVGFYVTAHPLDAYNFVFTEKLDKEVVDLRYLMVSQEDELETEKSDDVVEENQWVNKEFYVRGVIQEVDMKTTRAGDQMAQFIIEDVTGMIKATMFPNNFKTYINKIREGEVHAFYGRFVNDDFGPQFIVYSLEPIEDLVSKLGANVIQLRLPDDAPKETFLAALDIFAESKFPSTIPVEVIMNGKVYRTRQGQPIYGNSKLWTLTKLQHLLGLPNVKVTYHKA